MRIGNIKVVADFLHRIRCFIKDGNAFGAAIYPAMKASVPLRNCKDCGCVRALCIKKHLLVKAQLEIISCTVQKAFPAFRLFCKCLQGIAIQHVDLIVSIPQACSSFLSAFEKASSPIQKLPFSLFFLLCTLLSLLLFFCGVLLLAS